MESQPQNPEFRNNPENFHPWHCHMGPVKEKIFFRVCDTVRLILTCSATETSKDIEILLL